MDAAASRPGPPVVEVAALPAQRGEDRALVRPRPRLRTAFLDLVEEREGPRAGAEQPDPGVRVHPVLGRDLLQSEGLEVPRVQVLQDVVVVAQEQDVRIHPQGEGMRAKSLAQQPELGPLRLLGSVVRALAVVGEILDEQVPPPLLRVPRNVGRASSCRAASCAVRPR
jgi:hypothetical protein